VALLQDTFTHKLYTEQRNLGRPDISRRLGFSTFLVML